MFTHVKRFKCTIFVLDLLSTKQKTMKKILFSALLLAGFTFPGNNANAQISDGTISQDWTATDLNGNSHNLYTLLDNGYTVVIDLNATWCGPCWSYHTSGALEDLWENHGPAGQPGVSATTTDDVYVFMIESQGSNTIDQLNGIQGSTGNSYADNTAGDWVTGTNFPIIDDASIAGLYDLTFFPTIFTVCPNRQATLTGQSSAAQHYSFVGSCSSANGTNNGGLLSYNGETSSCNAIDVVVTLQNLGTAPLTAATIEVFDGATSVASTNWTGNLSTYGVDQVTVGQVTPSAATNYSIEITTTDDNMADNAISQTLSPASEAAGLDIAIEIETDAYGSETTWELRGSTGTLLASGGPYNDLSAAGTTVQPTVYVALTTPFDCTTFTIEDSYGDGMDAGYGAGNYAVKDHNGATLVSGADFSDSESGKFTAGNNVSINENTINGLGVYPNPFTTIATVNFNNNTGIDAIIEVVNMVGQVVYTENVGNASGLQNITIDGTSFDAGIYMINVKAGAVLTSERVVLTK